MPSAPNRQRLHNTRRRVDNHVYVIGCCGILETQAMNEFRQSIVECADPAEIAKKVKLAFKKMPGEKALFFGTT